MLLLPSNFSIEKNKYSKKRDRFTLKAQKEEKNMFFRRSTCPAVPEWCCSVEGGGALERLDTARGHMSLRG